MKCGCREPGWAREEGWLWIKAEGAEWLGILSDTVLVLTLTDVTQKAEIGAPPSCPLSPNQTKAESKTKKKSQTKKCHYFDGLLKGLFICSVCNCGAKLEGKQLSRNAPSCCGFGRKGLLGVGWGMWRKGTWSTEATCIVINFRDDEQCAFSRSSMVILLKWVLAPPVPFCI